VAVPRGGVPAFGDALFIVYEQFVILVMYNLHNALRVCLRALKWGWGEVLQDLLVPGSSACKCGEKKNDIHHLGGLICPRLEKQPKGAGRACTPSRSKYLRMYYKVILATKDPG
jgi:hypothetical protein